MQGALLSLRFPASESLWRTTSPLETGAWLTVEGHSSMGPPPRSSASSAHCMRVCVGYLRVPTAGEGETLFALLSFCSQFSRCLDGSRRSDAPWSPRSASSATLSLTSVFDPNLYPNPPQPNG